MRAARIDIRPLPSRTTHGGKGAHIVQGEQRVSDDPDFYLSTILGSCVAACLRDPVAGIGGMNHFLLPGDLDQKPGSVGERMGVHAMELLINELLAHGASRWRLEAKVFGGAWLNEGLTNVGECNALFAQHFLRREGITVVGECLGGRRGRRLQFWPVSGRARRSFMPATDSALQAVQVSASIPSPATTGALELF